MFCFHLLFSAFASILIPLPICTAKTLANRLTWLNLAPGCGEMCTLTRKQELFLESLLMNIQLELLYNSFWNQSTSCFHRYFNDLIEQAIGEEPDILKKNMAALDINLKHSELKLDVQPLLRIVCEVLLV